MAAFFREMTVLHFIWTPYIFQQDSYQKYEFSNYEIVKNARKFFETVTTVHLESFQAGRITNHPEDILLGHPTWGNTTCDWVRDNRLSQEALSHPNTYLYLPWLPVWPIEFQLPYIDSQLLAARKVFTICGQYWIDRTFELTDNSIQAQVRDKLVQGNMGCRADLLPWKKEHKRNAAKNGRSGKTGLLHISNMGSTKGIPLMFQSLEGLPVQLFMASQALEGKTGKATINYPREGQPPKSYQFESLGYVHNGDARLNTTILEQCDFYIHCSNYDAQATTILENCARGLVPLVTPESGFACPHAIYLSQDPLRNREIIAEALAMPDDEYEYRSRGVREFILQHHSWDTIFAGIWDEIQRDQALPGTTDHAPVQPSSQTAARASATPVAAPPSSSPPAPAKNPEKLTELAAEADALYGGQDYEGARQIYHHLYQQLPANVALLKRLTDIALKQQDFAAAIQFCKAHVEACPDQSLPYFFLGFVYTQTGEDGNALGALEKALERAPDDAKIMDLLGFVLCRNRRYRQALELHKLAVEHEPNNARGWNNLGVALLRLNDLEQAENAFLKSLELDANLFDCHLNLGVLLKERGKIGPAIGHLQRCLEQDRDNPVALNNLANCYLAGCRIDEALQSYQRCLALLASPALPGLSASARQQALTQYHSNYLLALHYHPEHGALELFQAHIAWARANAPATLSATRSAFDHAPAPAHAQKTLEPDRTQQRPLKIGYLSADYRQHSVGYFIEPILRHHYRENCDEFEIYVYSDAPDPDQVTERIRQLAGKNWRETHQLTDPELIERIRRDRLHILVELGGHTASNRLAALRHKPAPILVSYLGYPDTTGLSGIDYRITDQYADPIGRTDWLHSERLCRPDSGFLAYAPPQPGSLEKPGYLGNPENLGDRVHGYDSSKQRPGRESKESEVNQKAVVFASFNMSSKINPQVIKVWARILHEVPQSGLLLKAAAFDDPDTVHFLQSSFGARGIGKERLDIRGHLPLQQHLELYRSIDIALDPFPYNGTTTTFEALWMDRPVISLAGDHHCARMGYAILHRLGLDELVADSEAEYVSLASQLAGQRARLQEYHRTLRKRLSSSVFFQPDVVVQGLEREYRTMWQRFCRHSPGHKTNPAMRLKLRSGIELSVPNDLSLKITHNLLEHEDCASAELVAAGKLLSSASLVVDIGAGYGDFALTAARALRSVDTGGRVLAVEPSAWRCSSLSDSIHNNQLSNIAVLNRAVTDLHDSVDGKTSANCVMPPQTGEKDLLDTVVAISLDQLAAGYDLYETDVLRINLTGASALQAITGGETFLSKASPLLIWAVPEEDHKATSLQFQARLRELDYTTYKIIPRLGLLTAFELNNQSDAHPAWLFGCKADRAAQLAEQGLLVNLPPEQPAAQSATYTTSKASTVGRHAPLPPLPPSPPSTTQPTQQSTQQQRQQFWASLAYTSCFASLWTESTDTAATNSWETELAQSIDSFICACQADIPAHEKYKLLCHSAATLQPFAELADTPVIQLTLARISFELGEYTHTKQHLSKLLSMFESDRPLQLNHRFLVPCPRYDHIDPQSRPGEWLLSSIVELQLLLDAPSTFTADSGICDNLQALVAWGFPDSLQQRRSQLAAIRLKRQSHPLPLELPPRTITSANSRGDAFMKSLNEEIWNNWEK